MKNAIKKAISILLVAVMVFGAAPLAGFVGLDLPELNLFSTKAEAEETATSGTCGDNLTWTFNESTGELAISGTGDMLEWPSYSYVPWYSYCSSIKSASIDNGVTDIGNYAFKDCDSLERVTIPDSVTSIGNDAFRNCNSLARVTIPDSVTKIGNGAFASCDVLLEVKLPITLIYIGSGVFSFSSKLKEVDYPGKIEDWKKVSGYLDNEELESILLFECNSKRPYYGGVCGENLHWRLHTDSSELIISGTGDMEDYGYRAVYNTTIAPWEPHCSKIKSLKIENGVTSVGFCAFLNFTNLQKVKLPDSLTSINSYAFAGCGIMDITLPKSITNIGKYAFWGCFLMKVTIPDGVTIINEGTFKECILMSKVTIPASVKVIDVDAFKDCSMLVNVYYGGSKAEWEELLIYGGNEKLTSARIHYNYAGYSGSSTEKPDNTPDYDSSVKDSSLVSTPTQTTISYGDAIILHVDPSKIPNDGYVEWYPSNGNFDYSVSSNGTTCTITPSKSGNTKFTALIYDAQGNIVSADEQTMTSKAGFFDKLIAFFKNLFGLTKTIPAAFKGIY